MIAPLIYAIYREKALSPGKVEADAAILEAVMHRLSLRGWQGRYLRAEDLGASPPAATGVLHLAQGPAALKLLSLWEESGLPLINSPGAVRRCYRRHLFPRLRYQGISCPSTRFYSLSEAQINWPREFPGPGWLKRAEVHAEQPGDVVMVTSLAEATEVLTDFAQRHLPHLVWQEHVVGKEIKFYVVGQGRFFQAFWSTSGEPITGPLLSNLKDLACQAARLIDLTIFGGDVILTPEGRPVLIDLNDWPSFAPCREAAAQEIAHYVEYLWHP